MLFSLRTKSHCCVTYSFIPLETFPPTIILLVIQLFNQQIKLTPSSWTLCLLLLMSRQLFVLPRRAQWDHPELKQSVPRVLVFSLHSTHGWPLQLQCRISSRISKLEKLFAYEIATYTSITARIHSQYFFSDDKIRQLEAGNSDAIISKIPSVKFVFDSSKVARPSSDPLTEPATSFNSPIFSTHPPCILSSSGSTLTALDPDPLLTSMHHFYSPFSLVTATTCFNGPSRSSSTLLSVTNWIH